MENPYSFDITCADTIEELNTVLENLPVSSCTFSNNYCIMSIGQSLKTRLAYCKNLIMFFISLICVLEIFKIFSTLSLPQIFLDPTLWSPYIFYAERQA